MTNWERWLKYTESLGSPDSYIQWGGIFVISAALQRRVWCPPDWRRCYPNIYVTLVGKPGIGKGQVIKCIKEILEHWRKTDVAQNVVAKNKEDQDILDRMVEINQKERDESQKETKVNGNGYKNDFLFPSGANAVTYEELVHRMAKCIDRHNYYYKNEEGQEQMGVNSHCSMYFCLEEMASLLRKNTESTVNFMLEGYDSNENYEYGTKNNGYDRIRRMCLAFLAGTTPDFMQSAFDDKLTNQGYSSRQFFVYAARNRKAIGFLEKQTPEQRECLTHLRNHVKELSKLYGEVVVSPELQAWFNARVKELFDKPAEFRASKSPKLDAYYERWNIHVIKVALCWHFMNSTTMELTKDDFDWAIQFLAETEKTMHYALVLEGTNPLAKLTKTIQSYLAVAGAQTFIDLLMEFHSSATKADLEEALTMLQDIKQVETEQRRDDTGEPLLYYKIRR